MRGQLDGLTGEFAGGGDSSGFDTGEDVAIGGLVGGLLQLPGQEEGLFEDEGFQRGVRLKGTAHEGLLGEKPSR